VNQLNNIKNIVIQKSKESTEQKDRVIVAYWLWHLAMEFWAVGLNPGTSRQPLTQGCYKNIKKSNKMIPCHNLNKCAFHDYLLQGILDIKIFRPGLGQIFVA